jgi:short-subunit dehydrogenase
LTNGLRNELRAQEMQVLGLHVGYMDTDMTEGLDALKSSPDEVARITLAALEAGLREVLADDTSRMVRRGLSADPGIYLGIAATPRTAA